jgi:hypothetical protein
MSALGPVGIVFCVMELDSVMTPIQATALVLLLFLPLSWLVLRHFDRLDEPAYLRRHGIVIVSEHALQAHTAPIGEYMGRAIWANVTFKEMVYRFDRVQPRARRDALGAGELFLEPGLVYLVSA